jgi:peroxiredoxin/mono/diheme cytochrome c family protein
MSRVGWNAFLSLLLVAVGLLSMGDGSVAVAADKDASQAATEAAQPKQLGQHVADFTLRDFRGQEHNLSDWKDSKLVVLAFLGTQCPLAKAYAPRLEQLSQEYGPRGVTFVGINSNRQDLPTEIEAYARVHGITFPLLKDPSNIVADALSAVRTPEVFVLDAQRVVRYWGRIDDQYLVGAQRNEVQRRDLAIALDELLAGQPVSVASAPAPGCHIGRVSRVEPHGDVTWSNQIARLFQNRCVECHRPGEIGPFPLTSYEEAVGWGPTILEVVNDGRMPPWLANPQYGHFANDASLTDEEKQLLATWVKNGTPEGDPAELPPPREFAEGWRIGEPDQIIYMSDEPYDVPAEGVVKYQYFTVDPGWTEDKWIEVAEARPDNRAIVHHILAFVVPPGASREFRGQSSAIGYAPGLPPTKFPPGVAIKAPKGCQLVFQMHYTPNGSPQKDRSCVGFRFADPATVKREAGGGMAANLSIEIPPGADDYEVKSKYRFRRDTLLVNMTPHMHLRGKAFRFEAEYPDGTTEVLLDVPRYDFNWQLRYELAEPKLMPKGTWIRCTALFDNSEHNLANPNPNEAVRWGDQTWEEMMIGWFGTIPPEEGLVAAPGEGDNAGCGQ